MMNYRKSFTTTYGEKLRLDIIWILLSQPFGESYSKIINKAIQDLGFGDDYISVDRKTGGMISKTHPGITVEFEVL